MPELNTQNHGPQTQDLLALKQLASERSSEKRRELMSRLTDFLTDGVEECSDEAVELLGQTLISLLEEVDESGRIDLAVRVAPNETTPHGLVRKLAEDVSVRVAHPVLEHSPVLSDGDLIEIAAEHSEGHLLAISQRNFLSTNVTDAVIDRGTARVFETIADNAGAQISDRGFRSLAENAPNNLGLAEALSKRTDIPESVVEDVIASLPSKQQEQLKNIWATDTHNGRAIVDAAAQQFGQKRLNRKQKHLEAKLAVKEIAAGDRSLESVISEFASNSQFKEVAYVVAAMSKLPERYVDAILRRPDSSAIAMICRGIDLKEEAFKDITWMRCSKLGLALSSGQQLVQEFNALDVEGAQRTVRFAAVKAAANSGGNSRAKSDRRSGLDTRSEDERMRIGERRSGLDRRSGT